MPEYSDLQEVIDRAKLAKVETIINASFDLESSKASVKLAENYDFIYAAVGIHPNDAQLVNSESLKAIKQLARSKKVVAIGETGLDYYHTYVAKEIQQEAFRKFLQLAQDLKLPAIVHAREAQDDIIRIMREENRGDLRAVFHCFAGDEKLVQYAQENKFLISFTGNITFKKAQVLRDIIAKTPLEMIMIETDCPYLSPEPFRGKKNEPANVVYVAKEVAKIKNIPLEETAMVTTKNARSFFKL